MTTKKIKQGESKAMHLCDASQFRANYTLSKLVDERFLKQAVVGAWAASSLHYR